MNDNRGIAYAQVYSIIKQSHKDIQDKISPKFMKIIEENMDKTYKVEIDYNKNLEEPNILRETEIILGLIYRDYLCSADEKTKLIENENELLRKIEEERQQMYSAENLFKRRNYSEPSTQENEMSQNETAFQGTNIGNSNMSIMVNDNEKWYKKIWNSIMKLFKKN